MAIVHTRPPSHSWVHSAKEVDIPVYYSPYVGQNPKTFITPTIVPKSHDESTWSAPNYVRSGINKLKSSDITELDDNHGNVLHATPYYKKPDKFDKNSNTDKNQSTPQTKEPYSDVNLQDPGSNNANNQMKGTPIGDLFKGESRVRVLKNNEFNKAIAAPQQEVMGFPYETREGVILPLTPTNAYTEKELMQTPRNLYLQSLGPNEYSYSDVTYPINNNLGISYTPVMPPRVKDQIINSTTYPWSTQPLYHRIDPQLIRENQPAGRAQELPTRSPYSAEYTGYKPEGTIDYNNIYDGKFTGYGSPFRSYTDVNTGQVQYYYSDIDAYRQPNFIVRNKVDHVDFKDPMDKVIPEYPREVSLDDLKDQVESQWSADQISYREDLMERQMRKRNSEMYQLRMAPLMQQNYNNSIAGMRAGK